MILNYLMGVKQKHKDDIIVALDNSKFIKNQHIQSNNYLQFDCHKTSCLKRHNSLDDEDETPK